MPRAGHAWHPILVAMRWVTCVHFQENTAHENTHQSASLVVIFNHEHFVHYTNIITTRVNEYSLYPQALHAWHPIWKQYIRSLVHFKEKTAHENAYQSSLVVIFNHEHFVHYTGIIYSYILESVSTVCIFLRLDGLARY